MRTLDPTDSEIGLLGSLMLSPSLLDEMIGSLHAGDFSDRRHSRIYTIMIKLRASGSALSPLALAEAYPGDIQDLGGFQYLTELDEVVATSKASELFVSRIVGASRCRRLHSALSSAAQDVFSSDPVEWRSTTSAAISSVFEASAEDTSSQLVHIRDAAREALGEIIEAHSNGGMTSGVTTGVRGIDEFTTGFHPGELLVLAGRPGMGKTTLALNIASSVASSGKPVAIFSLEMSDVQLGMKMLSEAARVNQTAARSGSVTKSQVDRLVAAKNSAQDLPLWICDMPGCTTADIDSRCRQIEAKEGEPVGLVVLDYLQLMKGDSRASTREQAVSQISRELKIVARRLNAPVLALSQLNRGVEARQDKRPMMSDLRESGAIEQDADAVMMIFRPDYYDTTAPKGLTELIICKQRRGQTGTVNLKFEPGQSRFIDWPEGETYTQAPEYSRNNNTQERGWNGYQ